MKKYRFPIIIAFAVATLLAIWGCFRLEFSFDFQQFFPRGDEDLNYYLEFIEDFEGDDNFMLVGLERPQGVFDSTFLAEAHEFALACRNLEEVLAVQSLTTFGYPIKTPFAVTSIPIIHRDRPELYAQDSARLMADERFVGNLINAKATTLVVALKTPSLINLEKSRALMGGLEELASQFNFPDVHFLGPAYFQREMVKMQIREVTVSALVSGLLVALIMFWLFRRPLGIIVALGSIALGLLLFLGLLGLTGRELSAIAALYPVLMIIVGTSDVIHIMSKYIDELRKGQAKEAAIRTTIKEIGMATLLTSITTAIGFATLATSKIDPIRDFGINAAIGVLVAYVTVVLFTTSLLSFLEVDQIVKIGRGQKFWDTLLERSYQASRRHALVIKLGSLLLLILCAFGISQITTNYRIASNLPRDRKVTEDFLFFERELAGFRPLEFAIATKGEAKITDFAIMQQIAALEDRVKAEPFIQGTVSPTAVYRSIHQMYNNNRVDAYVLPDSASTYRQYQRLASQIPQLSAGVLMNKAATKARISSRLNDLGADSIKQFMAETQQWINTELDTAALDIRPTGTGLIIDKNAEYIRQNLLEGLAVAIVIVCLLMAMLFRSWRMLIVSLVPNIFPLLLAGAMLGYLGIELDAGVSIVFAVIFGIAVDDTIHFLAKYKLAKNKGMDTEAAIHTTFRETGKAIVLTSLILFFGFLVMLFSIHPPSVTIGLLISITLGSAVVGDLLLIPILLRWLYKD